MPGQPPNSVVITSKFKQAIDWARAAGFKGAGLLTIVAIAYAESGLSASAKNCNNPGGTCDRGILQFNSFYHSEVSDSCAYDPVCSFKQAYRVSNGGTSFTPWVSYKTNTKAYQIGVADAKAILGGSPIPNPAATSIAQTQNQGIQGDCGTDIGCIINQAIQNAILGPIEAWLVPALEKVGLMLFALVLVVVGFVILGGPMPTN